MSDPAPAMFEWLALHAHAVPISGTRPLTRACLDWSERVPHVAGRIDRATPMTRSPEDGDSGDSGSDQTGAPDNEPCHPGGLEPAATGPPDGDRRGPDEKKDRP